MICNTRYSNSNYWTLQRYWCIMHRYIEWSSERDGRISCTRETPRRRSGRCERERENDRRTYMVAGPARQALRLRLLATALAVFTMMCSHTRSPLSIWDFLPFSSHIAPTHVSSLSCRAPKIPTVVPRMRETRRGPRMRAGEKRYFEIIGDYRLSGIVPIASIPDIERVFNFTSCLAMIFTISGCYQSRIFVEFRSWNCRT